MRCHSSSWGAFHDRAGSFQDRSAVRARIDPSVWPATSASMAARSDVTAGSGFELLIGASVSRVRRLRSVPESDVDSPRGTGTPWKNPIRTQLVLLGAVAAVAALTTSPVAGAPRERPPVCTISGTGGDDILNGTSHDDVLCAMAGDDIVRAKGGADIISGGGGNDTLEGGGGNDGIEGEAGNDGIFGDAGNDYLSGDAGRDSIVGTNGKDTVHGGDGDDPCLITKDGAAGDVINGGPGSDTYSKDPGDTVKDGEQAADCVPPPEI